MNRTLARISMFLGAAATTAAAQPGVYSASAEKDAWTYPPVGSGFSQVAPVFGSPIGVPADPDRLGYYYVAFDLNSQIDLSQGPYDIASITVTAYLLNSSTFSGTNGTFYDDSYDSFITYDGTLTDTDPGRPIELYAAMYNNGLSALTWNEFLTPVFQNGLYNVEPVDIDPITKMPRSVQSNVDDGFDATPLAVATTTDTYVGSGNTFRIADGAELTFSLDLTDPDLRQLLADELNADGTLSFAISSLHAAGFMGQVGDDIWPRLGTRESFGLPDPSIEVVLTTGPVACSPADVTSTGTANGVPDGTVDLSDFSFYLSLWSAGDAQADVTTTGTADGVPDGSVDLSDFSFYLSLWSAGCP